MTPAVEDSNRRMLRARDAMDRDFAHPLDLAALSSIACVSESTFIRSFQATFGETPHRYLQRRRIERAMYLLRTTEASVTEVCMAVGYSSLGSFSRTFNVVVGESPSASASTVHRWTRCRRALSRCGRDRAVSEKRTDDVVRTIDDMYESITRSQLFVLDQDEALDFYVNTLGFTVAADLDLGFMRWLTVCLPSDPSREVLLELPGPPAMDESTAAAVRDLVTKGAMGGWLSITTRDAQATYETLRDRGVDITDEPSPKPYGIDFGIRDPFGNAIRIGQMFDAEDTP